MTHAALLKRKMRKIGRMFRLISLETIGAGCGVVATEMRKNYGVAGDGTRRFVACSNA